MAESADLAPPPTSPPEPAPPTEVQQQRKPRHKTSRAEGEILEGAFGKGVGATKAATEDEITELQTKLCEFWTKAKIQTWFRNRRAPKAPPRRLKRPAEHRRTTGAEQAILDTVTGLGLPTKEDIARLLPQLSGWDEDRIKQHYQGRRKIARVKGEEVEAASRIWTDDELATLRREGQVEGRSKVACQRKLQRLKAGAARG